MDLDLVAPGSFQIRCDEIYQDLSSYCRGAGLNLHMVRLTKGLLGRATAADFPSAKPELDIIIGFRLSRNCIR